MNFKIVFSSCCDMVFESLGALRSRRCVFNISSLSLLLFVGLKSMEDESLLTKNFPHFFS